MSTPTYSYEPFIGAFTGQLATFTSRATNKVYSFKKPYPKIERHRPYMMILDLTHNTIRMVGVRMPDPRIH